MAHTQTVLIDNKLCGVGVRDLDPAALSSTPLSYAYFCPVCAEIWARCVLDGAEFQVWTRGCSKHSLYNGSHPGSLWLSWDPHFSFSLPREALLRELTLLLQQFPS